MSTSCSGHRLDSLRLAAFLCVSLCASLVAFALCLAVPQQASAAPAVGETFKQEITVGTEQVECTFKVTGTNTVAIGGGGFVGNNSGIGTGYSVDVSSLVPALPMVWADEYMSDDALHMVADARGELIIPSTVSYLGTTYTVEEISAGAFYRAKGLTSVTIPNSVSIIGEGAFCECSGLTEVTIPITTGVTAIPDFCFAGCTGLRDITDCTKITSIGASAYRGCNALQTVAIPKNVTSIGSYAFFDCRGLTSLTMKNKVESIGAKAFAQDHALQAVTLSTGVKALPDYLFWEDYALSTVANTSQIESLGVSTFLNCTNLRSFTIPTNLALTTIPESAFSNTGLLSITLPNNITTVDGYAFTSCSNLASVTFPTTGTCTVGRYAFANCVALESVDLGKVSSLGDSVDDGYQFSECTGLTSVAFGGRLTCIPDCCFAGCTALTNLTIPSSVTSIGEDAFRDCPGYNSGPRTYALLGTNGSLVECDSEGNAISGGHVYDLSSPEADESKRLITDVFIEGGTTKVPENAFACCTRLTTVSLPATVTGIGECAFYGCRALQSVSGAGVNSADYMAFSHCPALKTVPFISQLTYLGDYAFDHCTLLPAANLSPNLTMVGACAFSGCTNLSQVTLPTNNLLSISDYAFEDCVALQSIEIPDSVLRMGEGVFARSGLTSVSVPRVSFGLDSSEMSALFQECRHLTQANVRSSAFAQGDGIQGYMFENCTALKTVTFADDVDTIYSFAFSGCNALSEVVFPDSLRVIESGAFSGCFALHTIDLPDGLIRLSSAFGGCTGVSELVLPASLTSLTGYNNRGPLSGCTALSTVIFQDGFSCDIPYYMFYGCSALGSIDIPDGIADIDAFAFGLCLVLKDAHLPSSLAYLGEDCFQICPCLESLAVPSSGSLYIDTLYGRQFEGCFGLKNIQLPADLDDIAPEMFQYCVSLEEIHIPAEVRNVGKSAFRGCASLETVIFENNCAETTFYPESGLDSSLYIFAGCGDLSTVVFRDKKPGAGAITFPGHATFYYTVSYYLDEESAQAKVNRLGFVAAKAGSDMLAGTVPAAADLFLEGLPDEGWLQAASAEAAITAGSLSDSGWALPAQWKGVVFTAQPEGGESSDGSWTLHATAGIKQSQNGQVVDLPGTITYTWYACDSSGTALDPETPAGTGDTLSLTGLPIGTFFYYCTASTAAEGLDRPMAKSDVACITVKALQLVSNPGALMCRRPISGTIHYPEFTLSNPTDVAITGLRWTTENGYVVVTSGGSFPDPNHALDDVPAGSTQGSYTARCYGVEDPQVGVEYHDTIIITSDNAATLEIPVTIVYFDGSIPYPDCYYWVGSSVVYGTTVDFGTLEMGYSVPDEIRFSARALAGSLTFTGHTNAEHFTLTDYRNYPFEISENGSAILVGIAPKEGLEPGTYEDVVTCRYTADGVADGRLDITLRVTVESAGGIAVTPSSCSWDSVEEGYPDPVSQSITVTNYEETAVTLPSGTGAGLQYFTVTGAANLTIPAGKSRTFQVVPRTGLGPGTYDETLTLAPSGMESKSISLHFKVTGGGPTPPAPTKEFKRLAGSDRYATGAAIAGTYGARGGTVILATGDNFPDALCASALAGKVGGPILMTSSKSLSAATRDTLAAIRPERIIVVGGTGAVPDSVLRAAYEAAGLEYDAARAAEDRFSGANRFATGVAIYEKGELQGGDTCIIATGGNFADALSISPYAYATETPIFLADTKTLKLDAATAAAISGKFDKVIIVGGTGVVSDAVVDQIGATDMVRLAGASRYGTSIAIAEWEMGFDTEKAFWPDGAQALGASNVSLATGANFPDALTGGALCGKNNSVLLLVSEKTAEYTDALALVRANSQGIEQGYIFGGTGAVSDALKARFDAALN